MNIAPVSLISFGNKSPLKTEFLNGNIKIKKDITGADINNGNVTLDHTVPKSKGGKSNIYNYSLMSRDVNIKRGNKSLKGMVDTRSLLDYIIAMLDVKTMDVDGVDYLKKWLRNLRKVI